MDFLPFSRPITLIARHLCVIICGIQICFPSQSLCSTSAGETIFIFYFFIIVLFCVSSVARQTVHFPVAALVCVNKSPHPLPTMVSALQGSVFYWCLFSLTNTKFDTSRLCLLQKRCYKTLSVLYLFVFTVESNTFVTINFIWTRNEPRAGAGFYLWCILAKPIWVW